MLERQRLGKPIAISYAGLAEDYRPLTLCLAERHWMAGSAQVADSNQGGRHCYADLFHTASMAVRINTMPHGSVTTWWHGAGGPGPKDVKRADEEGAPGPSHLGTWESAIPLSPCHRDSGALGVEGPAFALVLVFDLSS